MSAATATTDAPRDLDEAKEQADAIAPPAPAPAPPTADAKPKRTRAPRKRAPRKPRADAKPRSSTPRATSLRAQLEEAITGVGFLVMVVNARDGQLIMEGAKRQAAALDALGKENPAVRAALQRLLTTSVYAGLAMAFAPTLLGIAANHGMVPPLVASLAGAATSSPASGADGEPEASDPLAGVDLRDVDPAEAAALLSMFAASTAAPPEGESDGVPRGVVTGAHPLG